MARTVAVKINGSEWHMPASWKASKEVAQEVGDPLRLALDADNQRLEFTTDMVVTMVYIGCKHAGCSLTRDEIGEHIFEGDGPASYLTVIGEYIGALVLGGPQRPVAGNSKKKPSPRPGSKSSPTRSG